jgi:intracellular sulfur oxidation DsrE/DsrF family protein
MKTVFHNNSEEKSKKTELLGNVQNLTDDEAVEVGDIAAVINSKAIEIVEEGSEASEFIEDLLNKDIEVEKVPSGVGKLITLQDGGPSFIKI